MKNNRWFIYQLESPTGEVRYVGATTDPKRRYQEHLNGIKQGKYLKLWVESLLRDNQKPTMFILEQTNWSNWQSRERFWISKLRKTSKLLNKQAGGIVRVQRKKQRRK